jgi:hypothetical protein
VKNIDYFAVELSNVLTKEQRTVGENLSIRVILQKVIFFWKNYFFYKEKCRGHLLLATKKKFGTRITSYDPHFCQPNLRHNFFLSWGKNVF